jgi:glycosyltransferase involved in cell wall biosynthesis
MNISVIVATHNRADLLAIALQSLAEQTIAETAFEVIVVDNASRDDTFAVIQQMRRVLPRLRHVFEERLGLSRARNTGLEAARYPYVAYLDADVRAEPQWLQSLVSVFTNVTPTPACAGGPVFFDWAGLARTVPVRYWSLLSCVNYGTEDRPLVEKEYLVGANMAFNREILLSLGGFSTERGRKGTKLLSGEEAQIVSRIRQQGGRIHYAASAAVWHIMQPDRIQLSWLWRRIFWDGASQPLLDGAAAQPRSYCALQAYRDIKRIILFLLRAIAALGGCDRECFLDFALQATRRAGYLRTHLRMLLGSTH